MSAWVPIGVAAVSGGVGTVGALAGAVAQSRLGARAHREERDDAERRERLDRVAEVLGPIQTLLIDLLPARALMNIPDVAALGADRTGRWQPLRGSWEVLIVKEPDGEIRAAMRELEVAIESLYSRLGLALNPQATRLRYEGEGDRSWYDDAVEHHNDAVRLADTIAQDLHDWGNSGATRPPEISREAETASEADSAE